jgi:hypothetical protein
MLIASKQPHTRRELIRLQERPQHLRCLFNVVLDLFQAVEPYEDAVYRGCYNSVVMG